MVLCSNQARLQPGGGASVPGAEPATRILPVSRGESDGVFPARLVQLRGTGRGDPPGGLCAGAAADCKNSASA